MFLVAKYGTFLPAKRELDIATGEQNRDAILALRKRVDDGEIEMEDLTLKTASNERVVGIF
jgi:hypothetical protein